MAGVSLSTKSSNPERLVRNRREEKVVPALVARGLAGTLSIRSLRYINPPVPKSRDSPPQVPKTTGQLSQG